MLIATKKLKHFIKRCPKKYNIYLYIKHIMSIEHKCNKCGKIFGQKSHLNNHLNRKNPCDMYFGDISLKSNNKCMHCGKIFKKRSDFNRHLKNNCSVLKGKNDDLRNIYMELHNIKNKCEVYENENKDLKNRINKLEKQTINQIGNNNIIGNNNTTNNITNNNNIVIVAHGEEDLERVYQNEDEISFMLKKGLQSPRYSICKTNFNRKFPEYNNIYLPDMKNKYVMVYNGKKYVLRDTNEIISELYDRHVEFIEELFRDNGKNIPDSKKKALCQLFELLSESKTDPEKKQCIDDITEGIKLLLFNNKDIAIDTRQFVRMQTNKQ